MYIIQVKQNPNVENYVDMAEEEEPAAAKQRMKQLVGEYQSEGRIVEVKAKAKMQYSDYFDNDQVEKVPEEKIETKPAGEKIIDGKSMKVDERINVDNPISREAMESANKSIIMDGRRWSNEEVETLEKLFKKGVPDQKIGKILNRTKAAVKTKRKNEGIVGDPTDRRLTEESRKAMGRNENKKEDDLKSKNICMRDICSHYDDGECESFADIHDPIINSEGKCQGFDSRYKTDSEELKDLSDDAKEIIDVIVDLAMLKQKTPTLSEVVEEGIKRHEVYKHFNGYKEACKIAGLEVNSGGRK